MADQNLCGDPGTINQLGSASGQAGGELAKLMDEVSSDVMATVPDMYKGDTANSMKQGAIWLRDKLPAGEDSPWDIYHKALAQAAQTMQKAKDLLAQAQQFRAQHALVLRADLVVVACDPNRPDAQAAVAVAQSQVNVAKQIADLARQQIRDANSELEREAGQTIDQVWSMVLNSGGGRGRLGRMGGPKPKPGKGPTLPKPRPTGESGLLYGPEGKIRLPAEGKGTWSGTPGDSRWTPNNPHDYGLQPGDSIRWHEGVPDLSEHAVPPEFMKDGGSATVDGLPLTGNYKIDNQLGDEALAQRFGMTPDQVAQWRQDNDYIYHHYSDHELQLVPGRIHRSLPHQGSASEIP